MADDSLRTTIAARIDAICQQFEAACQQGQRPDVEHYLLRASADDRPALRAELLRIEKTFREQRELSSDSQASATTQTELLPRAGEQRSTAPPATTPPAAAMSADSGELPAAFGRYRVTGLLGGGGFGIVYRGFDELLARDVAVKVPRADRLASPVDADAFLAEARVLAGLDHSGIVPVYDAGLTDEGLCYVVSKFVAGRDLARFIKEGPPPSFECSANIVRSVAEALSHAHQKGLVHRDIKPANILLDASEQPLVADFGLALTEESFGAGAKFCGTVAYMSPEQARGEGHRVDARSDIYSLGVVFYQLLTGRLPYRRTRDQELVDEITSSEIRPPRQFTPEVRPELERICLKALAKRAADRYTTAADLAAELAAWITKSREERAGIPGPVYDVQNWRPADGPPVTPTLPARVIPKGLRSFDEHDRDFFLQLLPGPYDNGGVPDSIRFWKSRLESLDADEAFAVGVMYGPSGCGKSSLVKAGLLPRLAEHVTAVLVEATSDNTEARLLRALAKAADTLGVPSADDAREGHRKGLTALIAHLRRGLMKKSAAAPRGATATKVLIVLDQFEQWLQAHPGSTAGELVAALRQCDGAHVQCLLLVRHDFSLATHRLMQTLELPLSEGRNCQVVDLFDVQHARKVLRLFGRAYGCLDESGAPSRREEQFIEQAVAELAEDGRVVPVRLALFAEMVKTKVWAPATLKEIGGAIGAGTTFLEETFCTAAAPLTHRMHQDAARAVLRALLPERSSDIKRRRRSRSELLIASGYHARPAAFSELIRILDSELHVITPVESDDASANAPSELRRSSDAETYYQLTHDYLAESLHDWFRRKERLTYGGRWQLRLTDRAASWEAKRESRLLPSFWEWANIRLLTQRRKSTDQERDYVRAASRYHFTHGAFWAALTIAVCLVLGKADGHRRAAAILAAEPHAAAELLPRSAVLRWFAQRELSNVAGDSGQTARARLNAALAICAYDQSQLAFLRERLSLAAADELTAIRKQLVRFRQTVVDDLWRIAAPIEEHVKPAGGLLPQQPYRAAEAENRPGRFRALCVLAELDALDRRWNDVAEYAASCLVEQEADQLRRWVEVLQPVADRLAPHLVEIVGRRPPVFRDSAAAALSVYDVRTLVDVMTDVDAAEDAPGEQFEVLLAAARGNRSAAVDALSLVLRGTGDGGSDDFARRLSRMGKAAVALVRLGAAEQVWPLLRYSPQADVRTEVTHALADIGVDPKSVFNELQRQSVASGGAQRVDGRRADRPLPATVDAMLFDRDVSVRRGLTLVLGGLGGRGLKESDRRSVVATLLGLYRDDPDPGIHGAVRWCLQQWEIREGTSLGGESERSATVDHRHKPVSRDWHVNSIGQTLVRVQPDRPFVIATTEISREEFALYDATSAGAVAGSRQAAMADVTWYEAAAFCNWLSKKEGIPEDQWCYLPNANGEYASGMRLADDHLSRQGYRLPTEAEWELACRAGSHAAYCFGDDPRRLDRYALFQKPLSAVPFDPRMTAAVLANGGFTGESSLQRTLESLDWRVARFEPNELGLFDVHGNVAEWCDDDGPRVVGDERLFAVRGGSFQDVASRVTCGARDTFHPNSRLDFVGFRVARTERAARDDIRPGAATTGNPDTNR